MKNIYKPFPNTSFNYKFAISMLGNIYENVNYDSIKNTILGYKKPESELDNLALKLISCFYDIHLNKFETSRKKLSTRFEYFFNVPIDSGMLSQYDNILNKNGKCYNKIAKILVEGYNIDELHYLYSLLISVELLFLELESYFIISAEFTQNNLSDLKSKEFNFISKYLESLVSASRNKQDDYITKDKIVDYFEKNSKTIRKLGVKEIRLFGSFIKNTFHSESDIDLIIEYNDEVSILDRRNNASKINKIIKKDLQKRSDIHDLTEIAHDESVLSESISIWRNN